MASVIKVVAITKEGELVSPGVFAEAELKYSDKFWTEPCITQSPILVFPSVEFAEAFVRKQLSGAYGTDPERQALEIWSAEYEGTLRPVTSLIYSLDPDPGQSYDDEQFMRALKDYWWRGQVEPPGAHLLEFPTPPGTHGVFGRVRLLEKICTA